jgi:glycosyltransferase involved in cell wall biosynthesis
LAIETRTEPIHIVEMTEASEGGVRTHVLQLVRGLKARGFRVTLIASARRLSKFAEDMAQLESEGIATIEVPMTRAISPLADYAHYRQLRRLLKKLRPDAIHTHASKAGALGRAAAHSVGIPTILHTPHTFFFQGKRGVTAWILRMIERALLRKTTKLVVLTDAQKTLARKALHAPEGRLVRIPNGVDAIRFSRQGRRKSMRASLRLDPDAPVVGCLARLMPQKGVDVFIRAAAKVLDKCPEARFILLGSGPLHDKLQKLAYDLYLSDALHMIDHLSDPRGFYEAIDVFCLPSRYEGLPCTLLEAMSMERSIVATDIPGNRELVRREWGYLVPPNHPASLADGILQALHDRHIGPRTAAREFIKTNFSEEFMLERTAELITITTKQHI